MKQMYSIFAVYDYKGGELSSFINLSKDNFINELIDTIFQDTEGETIEEIKSNLLEKINDEDFEDAYAGGDGFCGEIYEHRNNKLIRVDIENYVDDIAKVIYKYNQE